MSLDRNEIRRRIEDFENQRDAAEAEVAQLEANRIIADAIEKVAISREIGKISQTVEEFNYKIQELENDLFFNTLFNLDYTKQVSTFRRFINSARAAAFLIHGAPECGQRWLMNRLVQLAPNHTTARPIHVDLSAPSRETSMAALWRTIGVQVDAPPTDPQRIIEKMRKCWSTQPLTIYLKRIDFKPADFLHEFIESFWCPLVGGTQGGPPAGVHRLLLFLLDEQGYANSWNLDYPEVFAETWCADKPVKLPIVSEFTAEVIAGWINNEVNTLPVNLTDAPEESAQMIFDESGQGVPDLVFPQICLMCNYDYGQGAQRWLKLK
jgi:inactive STAND